MNLANHYWFFKSAIPPRICDEIIRYGSEQQEQIALTGKQGSVDSTDLCEKDIEQLHKKRKSNIVWMNDRWIYKEIQPYINMANKSAGWNFEWNWSESCQFTKYEGSKKQHYDWHCDSSELPYNKPDDPNTHGKVRKLSATISLVDNEEYEGGDFEFYFRNNDDGSNIPHVCKEIKTKGSMVVFPSFVWHRVKPVTAGTRYSLVIWNLGWPFR